MLRYANARKTLGLGIVCLILMGCVGLDDKSLPADAEGQIYFKSFEIDSRRNSILGRIVNNSPYTLTSCQIEINIYQTASAEDGPLQLVEGEAGSAELSSLSPIISERLHMRETLRPEYSTEIYFELRMQDHHGDAIYTREIIEMKGHLSP